MWPAVSRLFPKKSKLDPALVSSAQLVELIEIMRESDSVSGM
jgi:hypothetical protein